ncbi:fungal-specific transcription factor domain-containing protein [Cadophora sp. MPI-SDFR-AT-0126]|nr:fungal-specific transcription factor domain-containing protein [Leotiomycetes sp. MPI-SDFR-AT-0126]
MNCSSYGKECVYVELPKKPRPSSAKVARLEEEIQRLRAQSQSQSRSQSQSQPPSFEDHHITLQDQTEAQNAVEQSPLSTLTPSGSENHSVGEPSHTAAAVKPREDSIAGNQQQDSFSGATSRSRRLVPPGDSVSYYGRTSALFEDGHTGPHQDSRGANMSLAGQVSEKTQLILMGEAARQRQMESINYSSGRLDFDGVDPELGMHLLSLHWNRQHHSSLITYRPAFMRDMACEGPYFSKLLLNAIYFGASKFSPRPEMRSNRRLASQPFRQRVRELLGGALDRSKITTIQALLIMTSSLFALGDERSASWLYAGTAFRMIIDLGLHIDDLSSSTSRKLSEEDYEIKRRVFWGAFVVDKIQSLYQGRPMSLQEADTRVPMIFQDNFEELESWQPQAFQGTQNYPGSPTYSVSTFTELCKLSVVMNDILNKVYAEKTTKRGPERLAEDLKSLHADLENWETALPYHLRFENIGGSGVVPPPHVLSLQAMHKVLLILLHRPFVSEGHLHSASPSIPTNSFAICAMSATKIVQLLRIYHRTFSIQQAPYLMSYATYVSATIHVRIAAQRGPGSEAHTSLATCLSVFGRNEETNWAVQRARTVILNLMDRMNVQIPEAIEVDGTIGNSSETAPVARGGQLPTPHERHDANPHERHDANPHERHHQRDVDSGMYNQVAGELDMDAIIQSFINEQQNNMSKIDPNFARPENQRFATSGNSNLTQPFFDMSYGGASTWNEVDNSTVQDMLFGFNGEALDGIW